MNPQFKIHGKERRSLKKKLSLLKKDKNTFWHHFCIDKDMRIVYGDYDGCLNKKDANTEYEKICKDIEHLEKILKEPYKTGEK